MTENQVTAWCDANNPQTISLLRNANLEKFDAITADMAERPTLAASGAVLLGGIEYKSDERELKTILDGRNPTSLNDTEFAAALQEFQGNPLVGCTSVLDMARVASGYDPNGSATNTANINKFNDYMKRVLSAPFFHLNLTDHSVYKREERDWSSAITQISNLFEGVSTEDKAKIVTSITNLANAVASKKSAKQTQNLFSVSAIYAPTDRNRIDVYLYSSKIEMEQTSSKGSDCKQTNVDILRVNLSFNISMWKPYARKVLERHVKLVDEWLDDNNTRPSANAVNLCVGPYRSIK